ncbi:MAG TPA: DUF6457 domain-containing protein [Micromonosporaceae bacterium]
MATLDEWTADVCAALGLPPDTTDRDLVLDIARDVAHSVARPAAPLTTFLVGVAIGRGVAPAHVAETVRGLLRDRADADTTG